MVSSSPALPHKLQVQSLIGEMTTSSLRGLATTRSYSSNEGRSIGPMRATSFKAVATASSEKSQPALWSELSDPSSSAPERLLLDAIAAGELDEHLVALADAIHARRALLHTVRSANAIAELCIGDPVRINRNVRPGYLHGEHGVIVDLHDHAVTVRLRRPVGRFRSGEVRCPPLALDKLDRPTWQPAA
jgi:hypothetical protein